MNQDHDFQQFTEQTEDEADVTDNRQESSGYTDDDDSPIRSAKQIRPLLQTTYPMRWYRFLIYFLLFVNAIFYVITAMRCFTGTSYGANADRVYEVFPSLKTIDIIFGVFAIWNAISALVTRSALAKYKKMHRKKYFIFSSATAFLCSVRMWLLPPQQPDTLHLHRSSAALYLY